MAFLNGIRIDDINFEFDSSNSDSSNSDSSNSDSSNFNAINILLSDFSATAEQVTADFKAYTNTFKDCKFVWGGLMDGNSQTLADVGNLFSEEHLPETIRNAVSWFKSEDLSLLYKVLDDPNAFGIHKIAAGTYIAHVFDWPEENPYRFDACIVGALAVAKAPEGATKLQIEEYANQIASESEVIMLGVLDAIINNGYLDEFKAEIQRQMVER